MLAMTAFVQYVAWRNGRIVGRYRNSFPRVLFTQIQVYHWNAIENPALVIWLMSGILVFDLDIVAIDGPEMARSSVKCLPAQTNSGVLQTSR